MHFSQNTHKTLAYPPVYDLCFSDGCNSLNVCYIRFNTEPCTVPCKSLRTPGQNICYSEELSDFQRKGIKVKNDISLIFQAILLFYFHFSQFRNDKRKRAWSLRLSFSSCLGGFCPFFLTKGFLVLGDSWGHLACTVEVWDLATDFQCCRCPTPSAYHLERCSCHGMVHPFLQTYL